MSHSYNTLFSVLGDVKFADRAERIAVNALPATLTTTTWEHQYLQQVNEVCVCVCVCYTQHLSLCVCVCV